MATKKSKPAVDMDTLIEKRGTWTLDPDALQRMSDAVVASIIRQSAETNESIEIQVGHEKLGAVYSTTRYDYEEVEEMIREARTP